jgi:hypothetical protein
LFDWHAMFMGQSVETLHATHAPDEEHTGVGPVHMGAHAPPLCPQAMGVVPGWQVPPMQQPVLQSDPPGQLVEHTPALQALLRSQSASVTQPQTPPARQAVPFKT